MDFKTTFLNRVIDKDVYIEQPEGFETYERRTHVWRSKKVYMGSSRFPRHHMLESTATCSRWDSSRVAQIPTFTI